MYNSVLVRYNEIGLKGQNRGYFENCLLRNIKKRLNAKDFGKYKAYKLPGRIVIDTDRAEEIAKELRSVFGISSISPAIKIDAVFEEIIETTKTLAKEKLDEKTTFRVTMWRSNKQFKPTSLEAERTLGAIIQETTNAPVNLSHPDKTLEVTIVNWAAFVSIERIKGFGGLPVGVEGTVVSIMNDDTNSKVSKWLMMKRGCNVVECNDIGKITDIIKESNARGVAAGLTIEDLEKITELKKGINVPLFLPVIGLTKNKVGEIYESIIHPSG